MLLATFLFLEMFQKWEKFKYMSVLIHTYTYTYYEISC